MKTMMFEHFAKQYEGKMALLHVYPAVVISPSYYASYHPWWFKALWWLMQVPVKAFIATLAEEAGQRTLALASSRFPARNGRNESTVDVARATDGVVGGGAYAMELTGETCDVEGAYRGLRKEGFETRVVEHTLEEWQKICDL